MAILTLTALATTRPSKADTLNPITDPTVFNSNSSTYSLLPLAANPNNTASPQSVVGSGGATLTLTNIGGNYLQGLVQGSNWVGGFPNGMGVVWNGGQGTGVDAMFSTAASEVGFWYDPDFPGNPSTITVTALNAAGASLGSVTFNGSTTGFFGIDDLLGAQIAGLNISGGSASGIATANDFALGEFFTNSGTPVAVTPIPSSLPLMMTGLAVIAGIAAFQRKKSQSEKQPSDPGWRAPPELLEAGAA